MKRVWHRRGISLYHGSAEAFVSSGARFDNGTRFDLCLTDPPYGQKLSRSNMGKGDSKPLGPGLRNPGARSPQRTAFADLAKWDHEPANPLTIYLLCQLTIWQAIWGGHLFGLPPNRGWLIWDKAHSADFAHAELAWTNLDQPIRRLVHKWNGMIQHAGHREKRWHPCQKPQRVLNWTLDFFPGIKTVCDPYAGGGSTGLACLSRGLKCVMVEREEANCAAIIERLETEGKQWL